MKRLWTLSRDYISFMRYGVRIPFSVNPVYVVMLNLAITWFMSLG